MHANQNVGPPPLPRGPAPASPSSRRRWSLICLWIGIGCLILATPCIFFGVLGLLGIVADTGLAENRRAGVGFLRMSLLPAGIGVGFLIAAFVLRRRAGAANFPAGPPASDAPPGPPAPPASSAAPAPPAPPAPHPIDRTE